MSIPASPVGYSTVNPFIIARDADGLIRFVTEVFDGVDHPDARTMDNDGLLLHAELQLGGSTIMFAERKPGWPFTPGLTQVYVDDVEATLKRAEELGAEIVTRPTPFFGEVFSRFLDPWGNLWWVYSTSAAEADGAEGWGHDSDTDWSAGDAEETWQPTPELTYIHDSLIEAFPRIRDPHA